MGNIVIPASLHEKTLETLHKSHMGVSKTIERARIVIFWPNLQKDIEAQSASCHPCSEFKIKQRREKLHDVSSVPWHSIMLDNFEFCGTHYLIIYDRFSHFIVVKKSKNPTARTTVQLLLEVLRAWGYLLLFIVIEVRIL